MNFLQRYSECNKGREKQKCALLDQLDPTGVGGEAYAGGPGSGAAHGEPKVNNWIVPVIKKNCNSICVWMFKTKASALPPSFSSPYLLKTQQLSWLPDVTVQVSDGQLS